jgi:hypothetical protein
VILPTYYSTCMHHRCVAQLVEVEFEVEFEGQGRGPGRFHFHVDFVGALRDVDRQDCLYCVDRQNCLYLLSPPLSSGNPIGARR